MDLIGLVVKDMAASLAFYRRLGFDLPPELDDESHVESTAGGLRIAWDTVEVIESFSSYTAPVGGHRMSLAFLCDSPDEVDRLHAELTSVGYASHLDPFDAFWGQRYATLLDPDENPVDLFAPLPSSG